MSKAIELLERHVREYGHFLDCELRTGGKDVHQPDVCTCGISAVLTARPVLKRYDLVPRYSCGTTVEEMKAADDGEWVRYEDVSVL